MSFSYQERCLERDRLAVQVLILSKAIVACGGTMNAEANRIAHEVAGNPNRTPEQKNLPMVTK